MRRLVFAAVAVMAFAGALSFNGNRAEAISLPAGITGAQTTQAEPVYLVCRRVWNGWAWVRNCYRTGGGYGYYGGPGFYGRPYWGGRRYYRGW